MRIFKGIGWVLAASLMCYAAWNSELRTKAIETHS